MTDEPLVECPMSEYVPLTDGVSDGTIHWGPPPDYYVKQIREQERKKYEEKLQRITDKETQERRKRQEQRWAENWDISFEKNWFSGKGVMTCQCGKCGHTYSQDSHVNEWYPGAKKSLECPVCQNRAEMTVNK